MNCLGGVVERDARPTILLPIGVLFTLLPFYSFTFLIMNYEFRIMNYKNHSSGSVLRFTTHPVTGSSKMWEVIFLPKSAPLSISTLPNCAA